jgi:glyoxylase-like metal-dependent hydrolase (beta-lactamase superfamily II)
MRGPWTEVGDGVLVRRYEFADQNIVAIIGRDETLVVDTRTTLRHAAEIRADLTAISAPPVSVVVNTHGHSDHVFGNHVFRPCVIWGHERCVTMLVQTGEAQRARIIEYLPDMADEMAEVVFDPPDRTMTDQATVEFGDRQVELRYLGRGHTDNDIILIAADADVLCAGDLLENAPAPYFGDGFPMDWPDTAQRILELVGDRTAVVPGHGDHAGRQFTADSLRDFRTLAATAQRLHDGDLDMEAAVAATPYPAGIAPDILERALAQLRGELG